MIKLSNSWKSPILNTLFNYCKMYHGHGDSNVGKCINPQTALGVYEFKELVLNSTAFVDKSLFIKDFLRNPGETLLITFPRMWGKSINMNMVSTFLSIEVNQNGELLSREGVENQKLFMGGEFDLGFTSGETKQLEALKIASCQDIISEYQGQYPVINTNFMCTEGGSYDEVLARVKIALNKSFLGHEYLSNSSKLTRDEVALFKKYANFEQNKNLTPKETAVGLYTLSHLLSKHFGKKSFILIDNYDAAINHSYMKLNNTELTKVIELFRDLFESTFHNNIYLAKGFITGLLRSARTNLFPSLTNFYEYDISDRRYFEYYGFTKQEVEFLLDHYDVPDTLADEIKVWYNGYTLHEIELYNMWSIVKCLTKFEENKDLKDIDLLKITILQDYWARGGSIDFLNNLIKVPIVKNKIEQLVKDESLFFNLKQINSNDISSVLKQISTFGSNCNINESVIDILFSFMFYTGYLTACKEKNYFKLPNKEVKSELQNKLLQYDLVQYYVDLKYFRNVIDQLQYILDSKDKLETGIGVRRFKESFMTLLAKFPNFDTNNDYDTNFIIEKTYLVDEDTMRCVMSYIALQIKSLSEFGKDVCLGTGIAVIVLTCGRNNKGIVIEIEYSKSAITFLDKIETIILAEKLSEKMNVIFIRLNLSRYNDVEVKYVEIPVGEPVSDDEGEENP